MAPPAVATGPRFLEAGVESGCDNVFVTSKYTALNFVFKNLHEQFQRVANIYFLLISVLQVGTNLSPTSKLATIGPLSVIVIISAIKEAMEDLARHREDTKVNNQDATLCTGNSTRVVPWCDVRTGQFLKVKDGEHFPADLLLVKSSRDDGQCYIETAELDGETNLKIKRAQTDMLEIGDPESFDTASYKGGKLEYEQPNNRLYEFKGKYTWGGKTVSLANDSVMLRGAMLRNTEEIYGLVLYTGKETKLAQNQTAAKLKRSDVEAVVNRCIFLIFVALLGICVASTILSLVWVDTNRSAWYIPFVADQKVGKTLLNFVTYLILFNNLVPISLYVSLEIVKVKMASFVANDAKMYYAPKDMWAQARTSNIPEDLGQIQYVFSDKTGTLTQNQMEFKKASFGPAKAGAAWTYLPRIVPPPGFTALMEEKDFTAEILEDIRSRDEPMWKAAHKYFTTIAVCHTVVPEQKKGKISYQAESPDEEAIVLGAKAAGYDFFALNPRDGKDYYRVRVGDKEWDVEKGEVNEFNSTRKRMSIIVRIPAEMMGPGEPEKILLLAKGADMMMETDCNVKIPDWARKHLQSFAMEGLRTLVVAEKVLGEEQYAKWKQMRKEAAEDLENQDKRLAEAASFIERDMSFVGVTAIEDKLQEGVPGAIANLRRAGLQVWVLTGDKEETAINIGKSCNLLDGSMNIHVIRGDNTDVEPPVPFTLQEIIEKGVNGLAGALEEAKNEACGLAMVVDGKALGELFRDYDDELDKMTEPEFHKMQDDAKVKLVTLGNDCNAVIGCRVSPKQKRDIVKLVKDNMTPTPITLSIGDGANDVAMIQEAHIGVGISGNEGVQAARSADYAIGQFKYLERLLLVHGRWNYRRICNVIIYSFYKTIVFVFTLFLFGFYNGASGTTLYESWLGSAYSVLWTFFPVLMMGTYDQDVTEKAILANPHLYEVGMKKTDLNLSKIALMLLNCTWHAIVVFFLPFWLFKGAIWSPDGHTDGLYMFGTTVNACCMLTVNLKCALMTRTFTMWNALALFYSVVVWFCFVVVYAEMDFISHRFFGLGEELYGNWAFWLSVPLVPFVACLPDMILQYMQFNYFERPWDKVRKQFAEGSALPEAETGTLARATSKGNIHDTSHFSYDHAVLDHPEYATFKHAGDELGSTHAVRGVGP